MVGWRIFQNTNESAFIFFFRKRREILRVFRIEFQKCFHFILYKRVFTGRRKVVDVNASIELHHSSIYYIRRVIRLSHTTCVGTRYDDVLFLNFTSPRRKPDFSMRRVGVQNNIVISRTPFKSNRVFIRSEKHNIPNDIIIVLRSVTVWVYYKFYIIRRKNSLLLEVKKKQIST